MWFPTTVVPALGDPRRERPPAVCGHIVNVPTHFKVKLPVISGHLPNADADSHLLVVSTCYNGQCKQMPFSVVISTKNRWRAPKLATDRSLKFPCCRLVIMTMRVFIRNIAGGIVLCSIARCIIFSVPRLPVRPCDERPPAMYGHFCLVPRVSVHDRYYCITGVYNSSLQCFHRGDVNNISQ